MKSYRFLFLFCVALIGNAVFAQSQRELGQLMRERGEYYFTLNVEDLAGIENLGEICSVDGTDGRIVVAYANQEEYNKLIALGLHPSLQTPPSLRQEAKMWGGGDRATYEWDSYLSYEQYVSMMEDFPDMATATGGRTCTLIDLGQLSTTAHRHLLGVRINNGNPEGKPKFLYTSTMHGDEVTGMILMLRLIDELCTSNDSRILSLLNDLDIYIFPCTNPDGTYYGGNNSVSGARRANGNNVDLNRNYKDYFNGDHPDGKSYQNETTWTMNLANENLFTMAANYHGGAEVMNYCWDWVFESPADVDWWEYVCTEYVQLARQTHSSYMSDTYSDGVTNGATWYSITGSRQDYMNAFGQCREVTVECSSTKTPNASQLPNFWNYNHNSMLTYMEQARNGVHGVVYDAETGQTLPDVTVSVLNHDIHNSYVTTHSVGDFHRPIKGGSYVFVFDKEGYARKFMEVSVADGQRVDLTVNLTPSSETQMECFAQITPSAAGAYLMGYLNGSTLSMPTHNLNNTNTSTSVSVTSYSVTPTDDGFTLARGSEPMRINLSANGSAGQYLICYKGRLLSRSSSSLIWAKPSNASGYGVDLSSYRWYVNEQGIYQQSGSTRYYLNYSNGSFTTSNTNQNNVFLYEERNCLPMEYTVTVAANPVEGGTVAGGGIYLQGETCTLTAEAAEDYQFIHWTVNGEVVSTDNPYSFEVTGDRTLVAVFGSTIPMSITVSASPARGGSVSGGGEFLYGETCTVAATPNPNYNFTGWTEDGMLVSEDLEYIFTVTNGRALVANFIYAAADPKDCYYTENSVSAGSYVMGYLDGTTFKMLTRSDNGVSATTATVTVTDYGFSVEEGTDLSHITLAATGEQFFIKYGSYYLRKANNSTTLSWATSNSTPTSSNYKWYINANGIYVTTSSWNTTTTYYLYYNNGSFALSTTAQNNINFYMQCDCPVVQTVNLTQGWNWFVSTVDISLQQLEQALGSSGIIIMSQESGYATNEDEEWSGTLQSLVPGQVYNIQVSSDCNFTLSGSALPSVTISIVEGYNWIGYTGSHAISIEEALNGFTPSEEDSIISFDVGFTNYEDGEWSGTLNQLEPGHGYIYISRDPNPKQIVF